MINEKKRELIRKIHVDRANFQYCGDNGRINGTLLVEIERVMEEYANMQIEETLQEIEK